LTGSHGLVNSAMGQIPCSTERISSWNKTEYWSPHKTQYWSPQGLAVAPSSQTADRREVYIFALLTSGVTQLKFTIFFTRCSQIIVDEIYWNRNCDTPLRLGMPKRRMEVNRPISPILTLKLVAMTTSLQRSEKEDETSNLWWNTIRW